MGAAAIARRNVRVRFGDSGKLLTSSDEPTLYWLDGHWSATQQHGWGAATVPAVGRAASYVAGLARDWYLIDDARLFRQPVEPPFDPEQ